MAKGSTGVEAVAGIEASVVAVVVAVTAEKGSSLAAVPIEKGSSVEPKVPESQVK